MAHLKLKLASSAHDVSGLDQSYEIDDEFGFDVFTDLTNHDDHIIFIYEIYDISNVLDCFLLLTPFASLSHNRHRSACIEARLLLCLCSEAQTTNTLLPPQTTTTTTMTEQQKHRGKHPPGPSPFPNTSVAAPSGGEPVLQRQQVPPPPPPLPSPSHLAVPLISAGEKQVSSLQIIQIIM